MIHLYTGEGKGKTTAATGLCIRAAGRGLHVCFAQFMKGSDTGELHVLNDLPHVTVLRSGKNFGFYHSMSEAHKAELRKIHDHILDRLIWAVENETCRMIIMDEITYPINWGLLDREKLRLLLDWGKEEAGREIELVLTGRNAEDFLWDAADYITKMECVRHPYKKGIKARKGIEF